MLLKNKNIIFKIRKSKVTDYAALIENVLAVFSSYVYIWYEFWMVALSQFGIQTISISKQKSRQANKAKHD